MAKIILISDIHYSTSRFDDVHDKAQISTELKHNLNEDSYDLLFSALEEESEPADLLIFCGDCVVGKEGDDEKQNSMNAFVNFLDRIEKSKKVLRRKKDKHKSIIIVPGNHDIIRGSNEIYKDFRTKLTRYCTPFSNSNDHPSVPTFIFERLKLIIDCETTTDSASTSNQKTEKLVDMVNSLDTPKEQKNELISELEKDKIYDIPSISASTSTSFKNRSNEIFKNDKYNDYLKIMVTHHPLVSGIEKGKVIKTYNATIGGFDFMRSAMEYGYTLFIHGHIHQKACIELTDFGFNDLHSAIQLGVPNLKRNEPEKGIIVIDTDKKSGDGWPFSVIFKTLSDLTRSFKQSSILNGKRSFSMQTDGEMKILLDREITALIVEGKVIKNGDLERVEAASYDCALGYNYKKSTSQECDWSKIDLTSLEPSNSAAEIIIRPQETILIYTYEEFDVPKNMIMHASPISSWLRKGLRVGISHFVDPGFKGKFCFPVTNEGKSDIHVNSRDPIMSIELIQVPSSCDKGWAERHADKMEKRLNLEE